MTRSVPRAKICGRSPRSTGKEPESSVATKTSGSSESSISRIESRWWSQIRASFLPQSQAEQVVGADEHRQHQTRCEGHPCRTRMTRCMGPMKDDAKTREGSHFSLTKGGRVGIPLSAPYAELKQSSSRAVEQSSSQAVIGQQASTSRPSSLPNARRQPQNEHIVPAFAPTTD